MKTILIVEDDKANLKLFSELVSSNGYRVIEAGNGIEAVEMAKSEEPDLVLMDIQLPGMDGITALKKIQEIPRQKVIPFIALTGYAMKGDIERFLSQGFAAHISKPINIPEFLETIKKYV
jgi:two-component system cell cycle response regulator DivK